REPPGSVRNRGRVEVLGAGVELDPGRVEHHREARVRTDDEDELDELVFVELRGEPRPDRIVDVLRRDELTGELDRIALDIGPAVARPAGGDRVEVLTRDAEPSRQPHVLRPLVS